MPVTYATARHPVGSVARRGRTFMDYIISGPHVIPTKRISKGVKHLDFSKEAVDKFWKDEKDRTGLPIDAACGCYIYGIRAGKGFTPWYVGQAKVSFDRQLFSLHKYQKFFEHYEAIHKGTPVVMLIIRQTSKGKIEGVKISKAEADWVEDYLTRRALDKNPRLLNEQNTRYFTTVRIPGIHNLSAKTPSDKALATMLSMAKPFGFTKPVGKFHKKLQSPSSS